MKFTIELAENAVFVPVAAVIARNSQIVSWAVNSREAAWYHAEFLAVQHAKNAVDLTCCDVYVTLEPCIFCTALLNLARVRNIYFGAYNRLENGLCSCLHKLNYLNANAEIIGGFYESKCQSLLQNHFLR